MQKGADKDAKEHEVDMHLYKSRNRIGQDRPHGINVPCTPRRLIKVVSGDTLSFTANVVIPATREPVRMDDLPLTDVYVAVAENRFLPVIWAGSTRDGWVKLDTYRPGLVHITVPRTVMNCLRRGSYAFSVVVDDGLVRETQLTGNFQVEYEPTGSINDIPYRPDQQSGAPMKLTPELDLAAQEHRRLTYEQLLSAVDTISRTLLSDDRISAMLYCGSDPCDYNPSEGEVDEAVHNLAKYIIWNDELRAKIASVTCDDPYDPSYGELVERVCALLGATGIPWAKPPCRGRES